MKKSIFILFLSLFSFGAFAQQSNSVDLTSSLLEKSGMSLQEYSRELSNNPNKSLKDSDKLAKKDDDKDNDKKSSSKKSSNGGKGSSPKKGGGTFFPNDKWGLGFNFNWGLLGFLHGINHFGGFPGSFFKIDLHIPGFPAILGMGFVWTGGWYGWGWTGFGFNISLDFFLLDIELAPWAKFYLGLGPDVSLWFPIGHYNGGCHYNHHHNNGNCDDNKVSGIGVGLALRVPLGFSFWPLKWLEPFIGFVPKLGFAINHVKYKYAIDNNDKESITTWWIAFDIDITLGLRFWW